MANPKSYKGKRVSVIGFFHHDFESSGLYLNKADAELEIYKNSVFVGEPSSSPGKIEAVNDAFIRVEGKVFYSPSGEGHMNLWPIALHEVTLLVRLPTKQ